MREFDVINQFFLPLTQGSFEADALQNDTAHLHVPDGYELVVSTDTLNEGVHFFVGTDPKVIAQKSLRVNVSDLVSSGAQPYCYQLALGLPQDFGDDWLQAFTQALLADQKENGLFCSGGDTTGMLGPLSITLTVFGLVPKGASVTRSGAKPGDVLCVTGPIGYGFSAYSKGQTYVPPIRAEAAKIIQGYASAAIDISDGLLADTGHIAQSSGVDIDIALYNVPTVGDEIEAVTGGDDYEIVFTLPVDQAEPCIKALKAVGCVPAIIGEVLKGEGRVKLYGEDGKTIEVEKSGWQHF